jgi:hypothetical protein
LAGDLHPFHLALPGVPGGVQAQAGAGRGDVGEQAAARQAGALVRETCDLALLADPLE